MDTMIEIAKIYGLKFMNTFSIAFTVLIILIAIDTATGWAAAAKRHKISSMGFKKAVGKILTYMTSVVSVRLVEIILDSLVLYQTVFLSGILLSILAITELLSILENLIILDVPIPRAFVNMVINSAKMPFVKSEEAGNYQEEFEDIKKFHLKGINDENLKKHLNIMVEIWEKNYTLIKEILESKRSQNNELLYVKIASIIQTTAEEVRDQQEREKISKVDREKMNKITDKAIVFLSEQAKDILYSEEDNETKLNRLNVSILLMIYNVLTCTHKCFD